MNKFVPILLTLLLLSSAILVLPSTVNAVNYKKEITKDLGKFFDEKKWKDACEVIATKENNGDPTETETVFKNEKDEQCGPQEPEPPKNQPPIITLTSPLVGVINQTIAINASISDPDGNITQVIWKQESGIDVNFTSSDQILVFTPLQNDTYVFSVEATDNNSSSTTERVSILVGTAPPPPPPPPPSNETKKIIAVGDVYGDRGEDVFDEIVSANPDLVVVLGDLWYGNWEKFQSTYGSLGNKVACVLGNHEYDSSEIKRLSLTYCGNDWFIELNGALLIGLNANENLNQQLSDLKGLLADEGVVNDVKAVHIFTHQPCKNTDGSHHGVEEPQWCEDIRDAVGNDYDVYFTAGHEHLMMKGTDSNGDSYIISGGGGRDHYDCGQLDNIFKWCDDSHYGYLEYLIEPDTDTTFEFYDYNGGKVN